MLHPEVDRLWGEYIVQARPYWEKYQARLEKLSMSRGNIRIHHLKYNYEYYKVLCAELEPFLNAWMEGVKRLRERGKNA